MTFYVRDYHGMVRTLEAQQTEPLSKDDCEVLIDQIEILRKQLLEAEKQQQMDTSVFGENGPLNAGVDCMHSLVKFKRICDDSELSKKLFDNVLKEGEEEEKRPVRFVA